MGLKPSNMYKASTGFCWGLNHTTGGAYGVQNYWHSAIFTPFSSMNAQCFPTIIPPTSIQMSQSGAENPRVAMAKTQVRRQQLIPNGPTCCVICKRVWHQTFEGSIILTDNIYGRRVSKWGGTRVPHVFKVDCLDCLFGSSGVPTAPRISGFPVFLWGCSAASGVMTIC